jgi:Ca2+-binding RTX toxin-like protein
LAGRDGTDRLNGVERLRFDDGEYVLMYGSEAADGLMSADGARALMFGWGGDDTLTGGDGDDAIFGGAGDDVILPGRGNDVAEAGDGNDVVRGFRGNERLDGGAGDDTLIGGLDDDTLIGGAGNDRLVGGIGRDVFLFDEAGFGADRVLDFRLGADAIDFRGSGIGLDDLTLTVVGASTVVAVTDPVTEAIDQIVVAGVDLTGLEDAVFVF